MRTLKKLPNIRVLVEGETEEHYWRSMSFLGKLKKVNLWHAKDGVIKGLLREIGRDEQVIIIADTDVLSEYQNFIKNIKILKEHCRLPLIILLQHQNFEDELCYSCNCNINALFKHFNATGIDNFKSYFIREKRLAAKLNKINHKNDNMWARSDKEIPNVLLNLQCLIKNYDILPPIAIRN